MYVDLEQNAFKSCVYFFLEIKNVLALMHCIVIWIYVLAVMHCLGDSTRGRVSQK